MTAERWQRLERIFAEALNLPREARAAMVARECGGDEGLQLDALSLLTAAERAGEFLGTSALERLARTAAADGWSLRPGERIGAYTIRQLIGSGGAGEVWRASDERLGREVAIKVLLPTLSRDPDRIRRFTEEARSAGALNHPNIVSVYDVGEHDGAPFIVSEYVEGESLRTRLNAGPLPAGTAAALALQLARGLAAAHARGIVHRDLKPDNVFLRTDGGAKILDFGLAKLQQPLQPVLSDAPATLTGIIVGTAGYMAPEQVRGEAVDTRVDLFALGVTLYEMLSGASPFKRPSTVETLHAILTAELPDFDTRLAVPAALNAIVKRLLAKAPGARFQSATDLVQALEQLAPAAGPSAFRRPNRRYLGLAAVLVIVLAVALVMVWRATTHRADAPVALGSGGRPAIAVMSFQDATGAADTAWLATGVPSMLLTGLAQVRDLDIIGPQRLHEALEQAGYRDGASLDSAQIADVARRAGAGAVVAGSVYKSGDKIRIDARVEDLASGRVLTADSVLGTDVFALVDQLAARIRIGVGFESGADVQSISDVSTSSLAAYRLYAEGMEAFAHVRLADARKSLEQAVAIDPAFAEAHFRLAQINRWQERPSTASEHFRKAAEHSDRLSPRSRLLLELANGWFEDDSARVAQTLDDLLRRFPDSVDGYSQAAGLYDPDNGPLPNLKKLLEITRRGVTVLPASPETRNAYGYALLTAGRYAEALDEFQEYSRLAPREPNPWDSLGDAYLLLGAPDKALDSYSRAMAIDPTFGVNGRAYSLGVLGRLDEAIAVGAYPHVQTILLARAGRYREAADVVNAGIASAVTQGTLEEAAGLELTAALLAFERRDYTGAVHHGQLAGERIAHWKPKRRLIVITADALAGIAEVYAGRLREARLRQAAQARDDRPASRAEKWWHDLLAGEIAFAEGDVPRAAATCASVERSWRMFWPGSAGPVVMNNLSLQNCNARAAEARGDFAGAIRTYRNLLAANPEQKWSVAVRSQARTADRAAPRSPGTTRGCPGRVPALSRSLEERRRRPAGTSRGPPRACAKLTLDRFAASAWGRDPEADRDRLAKSLDPRF